MDALSPMITALQAEGRPRIWSLVITVFGDSVEPRGGRIATARLRALVGRIGVEEGALRTALSRLASDGWVSSQRSGRSSTYRLTPRGRSEAAVATARIYKAPDAADPAQTWTLGQGGTPPDAAIALGQGWWIGAAADAAGGAEIAVTGRIGASRGIAARAVSGDHATALAAMRADLRALERLTDPDPLTAAAARTLLIHRWRRLVLRFPELPDALLPAKHPAHGLRRDVARHYHALTPASEAWLSAPGEGFDPLPEGDGSVAQRFRADASARA